MIGRAIRARVAAALGWRLFPTLMMERSDQVLGAPFSRLFEELGLAFIHIPKNAGTSISFELYGVQIPHITAAQLRAYYPTRFPGWTTFCVVRAPVERFLSATNYLLNGGINKWDEEAGRRIREDYADLNLFVKSLLDQPTKSFLTHIHFKRQVDFVTDAKGHQIVDRIISFDRLPEGLNDLLPGARTFPRLNATGPARYRREDLSKTSLEALQYIYKADFALHQAASAL
jgi:hypothetical protein